MTIEITGHPSTTYWQAKFSFAAPTCPVCGAPATLLSARYGQVEFRDKLNEDYWTVTITCSADPAHGIDPKDGAPREFVFERSPRYVFVSNAVKAEAEQYLVHDRPDKITAMLVRDIGTGVARVLIDPTNTRFTDDCDPTTCVELASNGTPLAAGEVDDYREMPCEEVAAIMWDSIDSMGEQIWGYRYLFEWQHKHYAERLAEAVVAGAGINPDGSVAVFPREELDPCDLVRPMRVYPPNGFCCPNPDCGSVWFQLCDKNDLAPDDEVTCLDCRTVTKVRDLAVGVVRAEFIGPENYSRADQRAWQRLADGESSSPSMEGRV